MFKIRERQTRITREGLLYLFVLSFVFCAAIIRQINLMIILAGMMVGPLFFSWRWAITILSRLQVDRRLPGSTYADEVVVVELSLHNQRRRWASWAVEIEDQLVREAPPSASSPPERTPATVLVGYVPGRSMRLTTYKGRLSERGRYRVGPLRVSTRFPFGLISCARIVDKYDTLIVYPQLGKLGLAWSRLYQQTMLGRSSSHSQQGLSGGDFYAMRDYRPGDNQRHIHWRTSARRGNLMVRQFEQPNVQDFAVIVDLRRPESATPEQARSIEQLLSFATTVVTDLCRRGAAQVVLAIAGRRIICTRGAATVAILPELLGELAVAEPDPSDRLRDLVPELLRELRPGMGAVLLTSRSINMAELRHFVGTPVDSRKLDMLTTMPVLNITEPSTSEYFTPHTGESRAPAGV